MCKRALSKPIKLNVGGQYFTTSLERTLGTCSMRCSCANKTKESLLAHMFFTHGRQPEVPISALPSMECVDVCVTLRRGCFPFVLFFETTRLALCQYIVGLGMCYGKKIKTNKKRLRRRPSSRQFLNSDFWLASTNKTLTEQTRTMTATWRTRKLSPYF